MRIAVIGAGITGLGAAWLLGQRHDVVLFEAEDRFGGHSHTVDVVNESGTTPVDTGFIVYNTRAYPNLIALFSILGVPTAPTDMSFSVSLDEGAFEYNGNGLTGLFGQPSNLLRPSHWRMAQDILRFFREAEDLAAASNDRDLTLGRWVRDRGYSSAFIDRHVLPMAAAIWSAPASAMLEFPAAAFARFFSNHGLLQLSGRPQWRTVKGGSREYVRRLLDAYEGRSISGDGVVSLTRGHGGVSVRTRSGEELSFDRCLVACHADDALALLSDADEDERRLLGAFRYTRNDVVLHRDAALMPVRRRLWTSWNYLGRSGDNRDLNVTYWMNKLQPLGDAPDYFVSLNPSRSIDEEKVLRRLVYHHPLFDTAALNAQPELRRLQGRRQTWFAGSYSGYGFHEDGLDAGLTAAEALGDMRRPWVLPRSRDKQMLDDPNEMASIARSAQA